MIGQGGVHSIWTLVSCLQHMMPSFGCHMMSCALSSYPDCFTHKKKKIQSSQPRGYPETCMHVGSIQSCTSCQIYTLMLQVWNTGSETSGPAVDQTITGGSQGPGNKDQVGMHLVYVVVCSTHNILYNMTPVPACVIKTLLATVTRSTPSLAHLSHNPLLHTLSAHCHKSSPY